MTTTAAPTLEVRFWGVRGSRPTPLPSHMQIGGNTPCVTVQREGCPPIILDAGTGLCRFAACGAATSSLHGVAHIFLTHYHWDHIQGIPFFPLLHDASAEVVFHSVCEPERTRERLARQMREPYFPVPLAKVAARCRFSRIPDAGVVVNGVLVRPFPLHHPGGSSGFSLSAEGGQRNLLYCTDHEHGESKIDRQLREHCRGAGLLIYDAHYTDGEYVEKRGWGHSTWREAVRLASEADVARLMLFHHSPERNDAEMEGIAFKARACFAATEAAREGAVIRL